MHDWQFLARADVVAMHRDIDDAGIDIRIFDLANESRDSDCDLNTARRNPCEHYAFEVRISLDDLVRNPAQCLTNCFRVHDRDAGGWILFWFHGFLGDLAGSP